ncbi:hypothetical protein ABZ612_34485 [Streptomyces avermitilis]|uniref:hypothetical protein n=1 Tax=Streptomyces avermitilis TaxID=33903 RepID=UPI0033EF6949
MSMRTTFEDRLLGELKREIELREAGAGGLGSAEVKPGKRKAKASVGRPFAPFAPRRIAVVAAACTAAWLAAVVVPGSPTDSNAYAVEPVGDGSVNLTVKDQSIGVAAQRELARKVRPWGIQVTIDVLAPGYICERSKVTFPLVASDEQGNRVPVIPFRSSWDVPKSTWDVTLHRGNVLTFENTKGSSRPRAVEFYETKSEAEPCVPMKVSLPHTP